MEKKEKKDKKEKPVTVHITNHNKFEKGVGAFITNLNHLTIVMDSEGNMKMDASQVPMMPQAEVVKAEVQDDDDDDGPQQKAGVTDDELVDLLKPIFYNKEVDVRAFLKEIAGMKPKDITDLVNRWVMDKRISDYGNSRKGVLWETLHEAGLYKPSRQNWDKRVL